MRPKQQVSKILTQEHNVNIIDIHLSQIEPSDLLGVP